MRLITSEGSRRSSIASRRVTRRPLATSAPASTAATSRGMSAGWFWRSPSIVTTMSPRARAMPACMAGCWPKLRLNETTRTRGSASCRRSRIANVPSVEPSSMKISSAGMPAASSVVDDAVVERLDGGLLVQHRHDHRHVRRRGGGGFGGAGQRGVGSHARRVPVAGG